jgi:hypothetical protein
MIYDTMEPAKRSSIDQFCPSGLFDDSIKNEEKFGCNFLDYEVMNNFITRLKLIYTVTSVRCVFWENNQVYPKAWFFDRSCIMVSVIDPSAIVGDVDILKL